MQKFLWANWHEEEFLPIITRHGLRLMVGRFMQRQAINYLITKEPPVRDWIENSDISFHQCKNFAWRIVMLAKFLRY